VIGFGCAITAPDVYRAYAAPGIARAVETTSPVLALQAAGTISRSYNLILDRFSGNDELEAVVLVHQDAELLDPDLAARLRRAFADPDVAVVGAVGGVGVRSIAWWDAPAVVGGYALRYPEFGGGELRPHEAGPRAGGDDAPREVDTVDGMFLALSPWAVANLRFDEALGPHWGYDFDLCQQARQAGRRVVVADVGVAHHRSVTIVPDLEPWIAAHMRAAGKWAAALEDGASDEGSDHWRLRARRAEAEAVVARLYGASLVLQADARSAQHGRALDRFTETRSWKLTRPLRSLNAHRRRAGRLAPPSLTPRLAALQTAATARLRPDARFVGSALGAHGDEGGHVD
jgi:GT2 family glycosyltransferase